MTDCIEGPQGCSGETHERLALSGSGMRYARCDGHYEQYVARTQPLIDDINRRYPERAPVDFDPMYAGERWDEEDSWP